MVESVRIDKLVHGGQGIGTLADGRRVFVWNALPGETVRVRITKSKHKLAEGVAEEIIEPSPERQRPRDDAYLSTSPWQMMTYAAENTYKQQILAETIAREHVAFKDTIGFSAPQNEWQYRNKMEYSFWADEQGLHLALFNRGTHGKRIVQGSSIAMPIIDKTAAGIVDILNQNDIRGSQLKTVVIRANQAGEAVAALFVKDESFPDIPALGNVCKGLAVYYSTPKSPASVLTKQLYQYGDITLTDKIHNTPITYDVNSFFQVNLEIFSTALDAIQSIVAGQPFIDLYSGVGTIGLSIGGAATLIESDNHNVEMAKHNSVSVNIIGATAETALEYIDGTQMLVVDPPRAGLHSKVVDRILETLPPKVIYLSCNPITQARDLARLQTRYNLTLLKGYNFFPRTPHIESLAVLEVKRGLTDTNH